MSQLKKGQHLGEFEEIVLLTVGILYDEAYGIAIKEEIEKRLKRSISLGALHATLVRLEKKGYLDSRLGDPVAKRGGKRKKYFQVTTAGQRILLEVHQLRLQMWQDIPKMAFKLKAL